MVGVIQRSGRPVIRRKSDSPKVGGGRDEFDAELRFPLNGWSDIDDSALLLFPMHLGLNLQFLSSRDFGFQCDERAVRIDDQCPRFLIEGAIYANAGNCHGNAENDPLASAALWLPPGAGPRIHESNLDELTVGSKSVLQKNALVANDHRSTRQT